MIIDHNRSLPKSGSPHLSTPNKSPSPLPHKPTPQQTAKSQQVHTHQSDESTTDTIKTETTPSDPLLAMVHRSINTSDDDASDISNVLSVKRSCQIQVCQCYLFQHANHTNQQLVDRGANGGLAGSDMRVIHKTHRNINIQGIDNHEVTGLDVVTAATLLNTSQGKVIGIFNEYAYLGKGSSIHSSGQLEWFKTNVDEKSVKVGGTQLITTLDGYSVPLLIKDGLAYATSLRRPTDQDMDTYPHEEIINTLSDNIRKRGAMVTLISDGGKYEISKQVTDLLRSLFIQDYQSEPYHQHQNKAENHFELAKRYTNTVMNTSGCPACCWLLCLQYICVVLNHLASPTLQGICPVQALEGTTPDISFMLHFSFYEPVYYRIDSSEPDLNFPSSSNEKKVIGSFFSKLQQTSILHHLQGRGPHFLFPFLVLNNLQILCHLIPLMNQHPILSNLSTVSLVKMKIIQSTWPTLTFPIFLADPFFYHLRKMGSTTWPKSLTLMTMDNLLKTLNSS